jgi:hypothetical protein
MKKIFYIPALFAIFIASCTEPLETNYKGETENRLIVIGEISTDTSSHTVILSRTVDYNAMEQQMETGATVTISDGENTYFLSETSPGIYQTDSTVFGEVGKDYTLIALTAEGDTATAKSTIKPLTDIDSIQIRFEYFDFTGDYFYKVFFFGQEPAGKGDYYIWNLYLNNKWYNDTLSKTNFQSDDFVDGQYIRDFDIYWLEPDELENDTTLFTVEMLSIEENYYNYMVEVLSETVWRGGPFDPTPANVSTNIEGENTGGFFRAVNKKRISKIRIKTEEEKSLLK